MNGKNKDGVFIPYFARASCAHHMHNLEQQAGNVQSVSAIIYFRASPCEFLRVKLCHFARARMLLKIQRSSSHVTNTR